MTHYSLSLSLYSSIPSWTVFLLIRSSPERQQQKCSLKNKLNHSHQPRNPEKSEKGVIILPTQTMHYYFREIPENYHMYHAFAAPMKNDPCKNAGFFGAFLTRTKTLPTFNPSTFPYSHLCEKTLLRWCIGDVDRHLLWEPQKNEPKLN